MWRIMWGKKDPSVTKDYEGAKTRYILKSADNMKLVFNRDGSSTVDWPGLVFNFHPGSTCELLYTSIIEYRKVVNANGVSW
jgi:hypothetical protein